MKMEPENTDWKADGMDLQYIKVFAVDNKGRPVPTAEGEVVFTVDGTARLIAVDNGDHTIDDLFTGNKIKLHNGFAMAIVRANQTAGAITVKAAVDGLKKAEQKLVTK